MSIIKVSDLTYCYGKGTPFERKALDKVSFDIEKGEFVAIIGHTGSGKSTLVSHLNGLSRPESGEVLFGGENIFKKGYDLRALRFKVGLVFQYPEYQLFEETVFNDIAFGPRNKGMPEDEVKQLVMDAVSFVGMTPEILEQSPFDLSGGQKRRVAIAGIMAMQPEVLVLDEPAAGLDPAGRADIFAGIKRYRDTTGASVIIISHSMEDMAEYCDDVIVMHKGKVMLTGPKDSVFADSDKLVAAGLDIPQITRVMRLLKENGLDVDASVCTKDQAVAELIRAFKLK